MFLVVPITNGGSPATNSTALCNPKAGVGEGGRERGKEREREREDISLRILKPVQKQKTVSDLKQPDTGKAPESMSRGDACTASCP